MQLKDYLITIKNNQNKIVSELIIDCCEMNDEQLE